jgi:hypothetical protein
VQKQMQVQEAPLPQDPPLQGEVRQVDLPGEPVRSQERPDLLPLIELARLA